MDFNSKKVLVTGSNGFIAKHLIAALESKGAKVSRLSSSGAERIDITNFKAVDKLIKKSHPDYVYHFAAKSVVEDGESSPYKTYKTNVFGTLNLLESLRLSKVKKVIIMSTAHVYGDMGKPAKETDCTKASRPYETSKLAADMLAQTYASTFHMPIIIPRFVNVYGPGDANENRLIPIIMKQLITQNKIQLWGGNSIRGFLYIDDVVEALLVLAGHKNGTYSEEEIIFNFGALKNYSIKKVVETAIKASGTHPVVVFSERQRDHEITKQTTDWTKVRNVLKWKPNIDLYEGLKRTYAWHKDRI